MRAAADARTRPIEERFWEKVDKHGDGGCWLWVASIRPDGYGQFGITRSRSRVAHRVSWEFAFGPIPDGLTVDHACHTRDNACPGGACTHRRCVNPKHLQLVTRGTNVLLGRGQPARNAVKTHCGNGHEFTAANTYMRPDGGRDCRACKREAQRRYLRSRQL